MKESDYQQELKKKILKRMPDALVLKNDPNWLQGFPDLTIMRNDKYAVLEVKATRSSARQPNQEYYIDAIAKGGSYASFVFPENEEEVLNGLQRALEA